MNQESISQLIQSGQGDPKLIPLDLAVAMTDQPFSIMGSQIGVWDTPNQTDTIWIRFNENSRPAIPFRCGKLIRAPFRKVFITVPAGLTGTAYLLYGVGEQNIFEIDPSLSKASEFIEAIRDELQGDLVPENWGNAAVGLAAVQIITTNAYRRSYEVQAGAGNVANIWIGYTNLTTSLNAIKVLAAGQSFWQHDYRGEIYAIAGAAGQVLHYTEV